MTTWNVRTNTDSSGWNGNIGGTVVYSGGGGLGFNAISFNNFIFWYPRYQDSSNEVRVYDQWSKRAKGTEIWDLR